MRESPSSLQSRCMLHALNFLHPNGRSQGCPLWNLWFLSISRPFCHRFLGKVTFTIQNLAKGFAAPSQLSPPTSCEPVSACLSEVQGIHPLLHVCLRGCPDGLGWTEADWSVAGAVLGDREWGPKQAEIDVCYHSPNHLLLV